MSVIGLGSGFSVRDTCMTSSVKVSCSGKCKFTISITRAILVKLQLKQQVSIAQFTREFQWCILHIRIHLLYVTDSVNRTYVPEIFPMGGGK